MTKVAKIKPEPPAVADPMIAMIESVVMNPDLPMERVQAMFDLRERQMDKEAEQAFNAAFASAMGEMPEVKKTGDNKHLKRKYSTLDDLIRASRPTLAKHGLSLNWQSGIDGDFIWARAIVRHALGHSISTEQRGPRDKSGSMNLLQGGGSTETYLKRYTGFAILGLSSGEEVDDDGIGGGQESISPEQFIALRDLIEETDTDTDKFLLAFRAPSLEQFPAKSLAEATRLLMKKKGDQK